jgi:hypothetical protein
MMLLMRLMTISALLTTKLSRPGSKYIFKEVLGLLNAQRNLIIVQLGAKRLHISVILEVAKAPKF